ncbi:hypothetical protein Peur_016574 [Populus x canadensis]
MNSFEFIYKSLVFFYDILLYISFVNFTATVSILCPQKHQMSCGRLVVLNGQQQILWSSNASAGVKDSSAQLTDDGNLVLLGKNNGNVIWESFQRPCNTLLPNMRLGANARTGESTVLSSWISPSDPSVGRFSVSMDPLIIP